MASNTLKISLVTDGKAVHVPYTSKTIAEDICISICKQLSIGPVARHIFALRITGKQIFLTPVSTFNEKLHSYDFRVRYRISDINNLKETDKNAFDYYFHQVRSDVLENKIPDLIYEKYKRELVGLGVTDMYRVMLEKDLSRDTVVSDYKKYIPKEVLKRHSLFIKKPIHDSLSNIQKASHDPWYVRMEYLKQSSVMAPEYLAEEYKAVTDHNGALTSVIVRVSPFHTPQPGIRYCLDSEREKWEHICGIDELCHISVRRDGTVEISRKNGIPFYLNFHSLLHMFSFVSLLDGYYRLSCKWIFNLCKDMTTPSLQKLYSMKCHGPVGGEFSYAKLEEKRGNRPGCFILRESQLKYNTYYIDVCMRESAKPKTFKLEKLATDEFIFNDDLNRYKSIQHLMLSYNDPKESIYLKECLPPSEYDISPLLLSRTDNIAGDSVADSTAVHSLIPAQPLCIHSRDLQVYKGQKKEGKDGITVVYRCMWRLAKGKKIEVAMKVLKHDLYEKYLKDFMELTGHWAYLESSAIVRLFGITLSSPVAMILEHMRLGPLDEYLRENKALLKVVDLIEAASNLASALWHLEEHGIVHGNIRCRRILVSCHEENKFTVKLGDPGIFHSYASKEVHWIPVECYSNLEYAKRSTAADVWAFATTLWEIFTYGETIEHNNYMDAMRYYASGKRLLRPSDCPSNVYQVMLECWDPDPHCRKQPQALLRDINQIYYQIYNSRAVHAYSKMKLSSLSHSDIISVNSIFSTNTESTAIDELVSVSDMAEADSDLTATSDSSRENSLTSKCLFYSQDMDNYEDNISCNFSTVFSNFNFSVATSATSLDSISSMQSIFELDANCNVILQGRIGQGFYGEVYKGTLEYLGDEDSEPRLVAVKKLKTSAVSTCLQDFEREISIMKTLTHPNIVDILGVLQEPEVSLVMEFVHHGSLQSYLKIYRESLTIKQLLKYALDIAKGMNYLGTKHIVHRDLAARNILVVDENHVKISDFGLAQVMEGNEYYIIKTNRDLPIKWYAPESLRDGKFSTRSDVWSYGVTMCEMFAYGEEPKLQLPKPDDSVGQEQQILLNAIESGTRFPCPPMCPPSVYVRIIYPCWQANPHDRPSFFELCEETEDLLAQH
ncbi:tyrosine-protein kinase hopscotch [Photinus pyralis]|uniref:non-specific protein-tyrosine kinase n=1 Tax=Photinus pyralis TaxID=7054 RepID=A0A1Y1K6R2_PHOPY|nr:tyrosine-protein kinase hopscotch [Photinus pyralis]